MNLSEAILATTVLAPMVGGSLALLPARFHLTGAPTAGAVVAAAGSLYLVIINITSGPVELIASNRAGEAVVGLNAGPIATLLLILILGVAATVQAFSARYLSGDPKAPQFQFLCGLTASSLATAACAATFSGLAAAWCLGGIAACLLLGHRNDLHEARVGVRRTATAFAVGDGALLASLALVLSTGPDIDLRNSGAAAADLSSRQLEVPVFGSFSVGVAVAVLVAVCALARSAQIPFHRWLPSTLAAPTPASAMLHAGLVNGAGLLILTLAPIIALAPLVLWVLLIAGCMTALFGTALSMVRADVKGSLAWSTTGQMGFMVAQSATGSFCGALLHLLGHGYYKSSLFLASGSAVDRQTQVAAEIDQGPLGGRMARLATAIVLPAALLGSAAVVAYPILSETRGSFAVLVIAWVTCAQATWTWLSHAGGLSLGSKATGVGVLVTACFGYTGLVAAVDAYVGPALPASFASWPSPWILIAAIATAALLLAAAREGSIRSKRIQTAALAIWTLAQRTADPTPRPGTQAPPAVNTRSAQPTFKPEPVITIGVSS